MLIPPRPVVLAAMAVRRRLHRLIDAPIPAELTLYELTNGVAATQVVAAFAELGLADALADGPLRAEDLATRLGADSTAVLRLARAAAAFDLCTVDRRGRVALRRHGRVLRSDHPMSMRDWAMFMGLRSTTAAWAGLAGSVRTGEGAFRRELGKPIWEWFADHPDAARTFDAAMLRSTELNVGSIVAALSCPPHATVCDVGGGVGALLAGVLDAHPDVTGILVDSASVLAEAAGYLDARGLSGRVTPVAADMFVQIPARTDLYLLKDVLHDWDDGRCALILRNIAAAMPVGSRVVLVEQLQHPTRADAIAPTADLQMLTQTDGGRQRSLGELHELLRAAGLTPTGHAHATMHALVEATR
ncbi:methyltransferase [Speluncibacter jeojiensis]|uniref:Acetylserotonin O-methyltransferase n=1 Tax=Speluncibacter jeojiensis TaxID=2710754 RepID=A0A9X4M084_9ACTN|nr:acetylserotonin O-methyltransferase [Corynebacteriales bacterium D3-21]